MKRRTLLLAAGALAAAPLVRGQAQVKGPPKRVGCLWPGKETEASDYKPAFVSRLRELGWSEGQNLVLVQRYAEGDRSRYDGLALELAAEKVDVILALFPSAVRAARKAAPDTPIVFVFVSDPVEEGFVETLARPGGNVTGASSRDAELNAKRLQLLKTLLPRARRIAVLIDALPATGVPPYWLRALKEMVSAGEAMGLKVEPIHVTPATQIGALFDRLVHERFDAVLGLVYVAMRGDARRTLAEHAVRVRLPVLYAAPGYPDRGGLASFAQSLPEMGRSTAQYVDRILRGARPAELPVQEPNAFDLVVNKRAAKAIGLTIPQSVLLQANRVIE
jgi:putative ABC transport system substrate-binding protein